MEVDYYQVQNPHEKKEKNKENERVLGLESLNLRSDRLKFPSRSRSYKLWVPVMISEVSGSIWTDVMSGQFKPLCPIKPASTVSSTQGCLMYPTVEIQWEYSRASTGANTLVNKARYKARIHLFVKFKQLVPDEGRMAIGDRLIGAGQRLKFNVTLCKLLPYCHMVCDTPTQWMILAPSPQH